MLIRNSKICISKDRTQDTQTTLAGSLRRTAASLVLSSIVLGGTSLVSADLNSNPIEPRALHRVGLHGPVDGVWDPTTPPEVIDVVVAYSGRALTAHGDETDLKSRIQSMVDSVNTALKASVIGVHLNPVFVGLMPGFSEVGSVPADWEAMINNARVQQLRNDFKADLVFLITEGDNFGYGSYAHLASASGNPNAAYAVVRRLVLAQNPTSAGQTLNFMAFPVGQMLGMASDREHSAPQIPGGLPEIFPFGYAHVFTSNGHRYSTLMSQGVGQMVNLYPNPNLRFEDASLGIPIGEADETDGATTINLMAGLVANYRTANSHIQFAAATSSLSEAEKELVVQLTRDGDLSEATQVRINFDGTSTALPGTHYTRPASLIVKFDPAHATATYTIPLIDNAESTADKRLRLTLSNVTGDHAIGAQWFQDVSLIDNDGGFVVTPSTAVLKETDGTAEIRVDYRGTLSLGESKSVDLSLNLPTSTATLGQDLEVTPTTLVFKPGELSQTIRVRGLADALPEPDEAFSIGIGDATATVTLLDDDRIGSLLPTAVPNAPVSVLVPLPNGQLLVGGGFTRINNTEVSLLARLTAHGELDPTFVPPRFTSTKTPNPHASPPWINAIKVLKNGNLIVCGALGFANGEFIGNVVQLRPDGSIDPNFQRIGFDGRVVDVLVQQDGRLLVIGSFDHAGTEPVKGLARLQPDGSLDTTFALAPGFEGSFVIPLGGTIQPDGRVLLGGLLTSYNSQELKNLVRLNADGSLDSTFPLLKSGLSSPPTAFLSLADGRTYLGGLFQQAASRSSGRLIRLTETGAFDTSYQLPQPNGEIFSLLTASNGKLLVCGAFTRIAQANRRYVAILNENGTLDPNFDLGIGAGDHVWASTVATDGNLWLGGTFSTLNNQPAPYLAKIRFVESPAAMTGMERRGDNSGVIHFTAPTGVNTTLETSTDLKTWIPSIAKPEPEGDQRGKFTVSMDGERMFFRLNFKVP